ncbi:MAG: hypothetical protein LBE36_06675 [Flavobacteriaceae bacterium]|jgi:hypothetical protein|nr:hypothetical protein [Flavobacteriaceae bacterium]
MKQFIIDNIISILTTIFGGGSLYAYYTEKKKRKIEEKQLGADALKTMQDAYDKFTEDALRRYQEVVQEVAELKLKLKENDKVLAEEKEVYTKLRNLFYETKTELDKCKKRFDVQIKNMSKMQNETQKTPSKTTQIIKNQKR